MTLVIKPNELEKIVASLKKGGVVSFPTETVFGVACQFNDVEALDRLMEAKQRDYSKAITLMLSRKEDIEKYAYVNDKVLQIADKFMPGALTLVLKRKESVDPLMTNNLDTIGIRIPDSAFVLDLIEKAGPLLVTSANLSGYENTSNHYEVLKQLDGRIDLVVEGESHGHVASTVVLMIDDEMKILRQGQITLDQLKEALR